MVAARKTKDLKKAQSTYRQDRDSDATVIKGAPISKKPPMILNAREDRKFKDLINQSTKHDLQQSDAHALCILAKTLIRIEDDEASASDYSRARQLLNDFGMTPVGRTRLSKSSDDDSAGANWGKFK